MNIPQLTMLLVIHTDKDFVPEQSGPDQMNKDWLIKQELVQISSDRGNSIYQITDKGKVYIDHLCEQPLPVSQWAIPA